MRAAKALPMGTPLDYASSGVDREGREKAKSLFSGFRDTYALSRHGKVLETPFNTLYPVSRGGDVLHVKTSDGVGTKVMLAQLAGKHDTIGIDAVAMVANDCIRCGAEPLALTNVIDAKKSTPELLSALQKGLIRGAEEAGCPMVGGETADVPELMAVPYHINADCVGEVDRGNVIDGSRLSEGDAVIGIRSSGLHSNGISLARRALFREWGGRFEGSEPLESTGTPILSEALAPTRIYVKLFARLKSEVEVLGAVHVTGDAYLKFARLSPLGFRLDNFRPQEIFSLVQEAGSVSWEEMFKTFNMGWGFAVVVRKEDCGDALQALGSGAEQIGSVGGAGIEIGFRGERFRLK
jgi:phosphoribosylformylglycinamidine cyclo-ligase